MLLQNGQGQGFCRKMLAEIAAGPRRGRVEECARVVMAGPCLQQIADAEILLEAEPGHYQPDDSPSMPRALGVFACTKIRAMRRTLQSSSADHKRAQEPRRDRVETESFRWYS